MHAAQAHDRAPEAANAERRASTPPRHAAVGPEDE
jgi:hypothetical protein